MYCIHKDIVKRFLLSSLQSLTSTDVSSNHWFRHQAAQYLGVSHCREMFVEFWKYKSLKYYICQPGLWLFTWYIILLAHSPLQGIFKAASLSTVIHNCHWQGEQGGYLLSPPWSAKLAVWMQLSSVQQREKWKTSFDLMLIQHLIRFSRNTS